MKSLALLGLALAGAAIAAPPVSSPFSQLPQEAPQAEAEKQVIRSKNQSIIGQSTILHDGESWTLVPKGAVLHIPIAMKARVDAKPVGSLLPWSDFLVKNRAWLATQDVDLSQAAGRQPLPADRIAAWAKQDKVVVAVHYAGPISVRPSEPQTAATP